LRPVWMTNHPPSVLWHCWLGHQTCKNRRPYNLLCWRRRKTMLNQPNPQLLPLKLHLSLQNLVFIATHPSPQRL